MTTACVISQSIETDSPRELAEDLDIEASDEELQDIAQEIHEIALKHKGEDTSADLSEEANRD